MHISDWSSDVCSSDLGLSDGRSRSGADQMGPHRSAAPDAVGGAGAEILVRGGQPVRGAGRSRADRKSVVEGQSVSVRVDLGGRRIMNKKQHYEQSTDNGSINLNDTQLQPKPMI